MEQTSESEIPLSPSRTCDIVMKGGITSGIVYPEAVCELAKEYRFINIGGTSAGAIAAALTAAAEYNRTKFNSIDGFIKLKEIPHILGKSEAGKTKLFSLFQPNNSTKKIFNFLIKILAEKTWKRKVIAGLISFAQQFPILSIFCFIPTSFLTILLICGDIKWIYSIIAILFSACLIPFTLLILSSIRVIPLFIKTLCKNNFGLTTGYLQNRKASTEPLTEWLSMKINEISGLPPTEPLTFGHLSDSGNDFGIKLKVMTTNLTWGRPISFPFSDTNLDKVFYYDENELKDFFPDNVLQWMRKHSIKSEDGKLKLPDSDKLPIIVAARMSLSFPVLISAVPLYAIDYSLKTDDSKDEPEILEKCIFSDGGICSNFPIHFFDSLLPRRPTFALNLSPFHIKYPQDPDNECKNIHMIRGSGGGRSEHWTRISSIMNFFSSVMNTMQNWSDNTQAKVAGYRDRIAHIHLNKLEGGLNLDMKSSIIDKLSERGKCAGELLVKRFTSNDEVKLDWNNHRWTRFRTTLCLLEIYLNQMEAALDVNTSTIEMSYEDLISRDDNTDPNSYRFTNSNQKNEAQKFITEMRKLIQKFKLITPSFCDGAPNPLPELRIKPKI